jgi:hypothetical protein
MGVLILLAVIIVGVLLCAGAVAALVLLIVFNRRRRTLTEGRAMPDVPRDGPPDDDRPWGRPARPLRQPASAAPLVVTSSRA